MPTDPNERNSIPPEPPTPRERLHFRIWLSIVAFLVIGSLALTGLMMFVWPPSTPVQGSRGHPRWNTSSTSVPEAATTSTSVSSFATNEGGAADISAGTVWVNTRSHIYHFPGYRWYGRTIQGRYTSEQEAVAEGDRAALNERRPARFGIRVLPRDRRGLFQR